MKKLAVRLTLLVSMTLLPIPSRCEQLPALSGFKQPISQCLKPADNLIITQVGEYPELPIGTPPLEIVASVQPDTDPNVIAEVDHAAINIYDTGCHILYREEFSGAGEVTFETIHWGYQTLLHVIAMSAVGEPADDVIYIHILLTGDGGVFLPAGPPFLQSDKNLSIFIGNIGGGRGFGIVETFRPWPAPPHFSPFSVMFQLKNVRLPQGQTLSAFVGPTCDPAASSQRQPRSLARHVIRNGLSADALPLWEVGWRLAEIATDTPPMKPACQRGAKIKIYAPPHSLPCRCQAYYKRECAQSALPGRSVKAQATLSTQVPPDVP